LGLNYNDVRCLLEWRQRGAGGKVATLGRLNLNLHWKDILKLRQQLANDARALSWLDRYRWADFADEMLCEAMGFASVTSIDISQYEGASIVQDISMPLRSDLIGQFDLAIDGGTLEHVFNYPAAVANLMRLVKVGGAVYTQNPCNSLAGHGFYQFSPELMYRVFSKQNGFVISFVRVAIALGQQVEQTTGQPVYEVTDPVKYGGRVLLAGPNPAILMSLAIKCADVEPFTQPVLQSDYLAKWSDTSASGLNWKGRLIEYVGKKFAFVSTTISRYRDRNDASVRNARAYRRLW
jgi:hypothetical protein